MAETSGKAFADTFARLQTSEAVERNSLTAIQRLKDEGDRDKLTRNRKQAEVFLQRSETMQRLLQELRSQRPGADLSGLEGIAQGLAETAARLNVAGGMNEDAALQLSGSTAGAAQAARVLPTRQKALEASAAETATLTAREPFQERQAERESALKRQEAVQQSELRRAEFSARPQTDLGKLTFDRELAAKTFGEDSEQVKAFDEALADGGREPPKLTDIGGVRKEFTKASGEFISIQDAFGRLMASPDTAGGDVATVFNFMKMLDPASVVREGEFATAAQAAGLPDRLIQLARRVDTGERLTTDQRKDFRNVARSIFKQQLQGQRVLEQTFSALSKRLGMNPAEVVISFTRPRLVERAREAGVEQPSGGRSRKTLNTVQEVEEFKKNNPSGTEFFWAPTGQVLRID